MSRIKLSEHLYADEIACKCGKCGRAKMDLEFLTRFELVRAGVAKFYGYPRPIICTNAWRGRNGGNRCPANNKKAGGASKSDHMIYPGVALDVFIPGMTTREVGWWAKWSGFNALGLYTHNIHMGLRGTINKRRTHQWGPHAGRYKEPKIINRTGV